MRQDDHATRVADAIERLGRFLRARGYAEHLNPAQWEALRYLDRCNRHSNNPTALAGFLGATKGTVSQTVTALERKGMVRKRPRPGRGRALEIVLTDRGRDVLTRDPVAEMATAANGIDDELPALADRLETLLKELQEVAGLRTFGQCRTCRYLGTDKSKDGSCRCALLGTRITEDDAGRICAEHVPH